MQPPPERGPDCAQQVTRPAFKTKPGAAEVQALSMGEAAHGSAQTATDDRSSLRAQRDAPALNIRPIRQGVTSEQGHRRSSGNGTDRGSDRFSDARSRRPPGGRQAARASQHSVGCRRARDRHPWCAGSAEPGSANPHRRCAGLHQGRCQLRSVLLPIVDLRLVPACEPHASTDFVPVVALNERGRVSGSRSIRCPTFWHWMQTHSAGHRTECSGR